MSFKQIYLEPNSVTIRNNKDEKELGITFDNKLDFSTHLTRICKKTNIKLNVFTRVQKYMTSGQKTPSFLKSQFNYCPLIFMFYSKKALHRLTNKNE